MIGHEAALTRAGGAFVLTCACAWVSAAHALLSAALREHVWRDHR